MNCQLCNQHMYSYFDGEISAQLKQEIDRHIAQCSSCRFQYDLTRQENLILHDSSDIPALSPDFNQRVLQTIAQQPISPVEELLTMSKPTLDHRFRWPLYTKAAVAVVLLALCIYIPGIMLDSQEKIAQISDQTISQSQYKTKVPAPANITGAEGGTGAVNELKKEHLQIMNDKSSDQIELSLPGTQYNVEYGDSSLTKKLDGDILKWGSQDVGRCDRKVASFAAPSAPASVPNWSLQNIPAQYQLLNMTNTNDHQAEYNYQTPDGIENLTVKIVAVTVQSSEVIVGSVGVSNSEPAPGLLTARDKAPDSVSRELQVGNEKFKLILSGNLSSEELTQIAGNIEIKQNP